MTQKHVNNSQYTINNPEYIDPSYNIKYFNQYLRDNNIDTTVPANYLQEYTNKVNINSNYNFDVGISTGFLKYLDSYKSYPNENNPNEDYKQRHIEINNYYIMKYQSEIYIFKLIIFFCGLAIVGSLFFLKGFINETIYIIYLGIIIASGIIMISYNIYKLIFRDNIRFDETDFGYIKSPGTDISYGELPIDDDANPNKKDDDKCV